MEFLVFDLAYELGRLPSEVRAFPMSELLEWLEFFERKFPPQQNQG